MAKSVWASLVVSIGLLSAQAPALASGSCSGRFINPITDICWSCLFPISIGGATVVSGKNPDTKNPSSPIQVCQTGSLIRVGLAIGYWEPFAVTDVTRNPYCMVNLGGIQPKINYGDVDGATETPSSGSEGAFYQVHWYKYPLIAWLNILTDMGCMQSGDFDLAYLSELDPMWGNDQTSMFINPEAVLFGNRLAQDACAIDAAAASTGKAKNTLFWCMGSQGSSYPMTGHSSAEYSVLQNSVLLTERMAYKLHREGLVEDSSGDNTAVCRQHIRPIIPKDRYRYELMNPTPDANSCHSFGHTVTTWQTGKNKPNDKGNYGYLVWRKRNCVFM